MDPRGRDVQLGDRRGHWPVGDVRGVIEYRHLMQIQHRNREIGSRRHGQIGQGGREVRRRRRGRHGQIGQGGRNEVQRPCVDDAVVERHTVVGPPNVAEQAEMRRRGAQRSRLLAFIPAPYTLSKVGQDWGFCPGERSVPVRSAPLRSTPLRSAPLRLAPLRMALVRSAPLRMALVRSAPLRMAPVRLAPLRSALPRTAKLRLALQSPALLSLAPLRLAPLRSAPLRSAPLRSAFLMSALVRSALVRSAPLRLAP